MNGRRLSPQELAERFGALQRDHEKRVKRSNAHKARRQTQEDAAVFLRSQETVSVGSNVGDTLREKYRDGYRLRNSKGHFVGLPKGS